MAFFNFLKKPADGAKPSVSPYHDETTNFIYNLLFCDDIDLYKKEKPNLLNYPFDILFSEKSTVDDLQRLIEKDSLDTRIKILAYRQQLEKGKPAKTKELLAVIVEVGLEKGLDVLASFKDGTARYINQTGKILIWETSDEKSSELTADLFKNSEEIVAKIGPWDEARKPAPIQGNVRITFLVSDGLYFGEGPISVLFNDPMAGPALTSATYLMKYLTEKSLKDESENV